jgi:hypothetical protein
MRRAINSTSGKTSDLVDRLELSNKGQLTLPGVEPLHGLSDLLQRWV